ncbi:hypothetical protein HK101_009936 [Irineochytrium annulatum]|nr:hypothetical protein HK101_009936 [Irineochytrium annulatum]
MKYSFLIAIIAAIALAAWATADSAQDPQEHPNLDINIATEGNKCEHMFVPTREFKIILPNECLPKGLHVRINMETGLKEAKLMDDSGSGEKAMSVHVPASLSSPDYVDEYAVYTLTGSVSDVIANLTDLEDVVGAFEDGVEFGQSPTSLAVLELASSSPDAGVRSRAARVLSACFANNPKARSAAKAESEFLPVVMDRLLGSAEVEPEKDAHVASSLLFTLGALLRGDAPMMGAFHARRGLQRLAALYKATPVAQKNLRTKLIGVAMDIFDASILDEGEVHVATLMKEAKSALSRSAFCRMVDGGEMVEQLVAAAGGCTVEVENDELAGRRFLVLVAPTSLDHVQDIYEKLFHPALASPVALTRSRINYNSSLRPEDTPDILDPRVLSIYGQIAKSAVERSPTLIVLLSATKVQSPLFISMSTVDEFVSEVDAGPSTFVLKVGGEEYRFTCASSHEYQEWEDALTDALDSAERGCVRIERNRTRRGSNVAASSTSEVQTASSVALGVNAELGSDILARTGSALSGASMASSTQAYSINSAGSGGGSLEQLGEQRSASVPTVNGPLSRRTLKWKSSVTSLFTRRANSHHNFLHHEDPNERAALSPFNPNSASHEEIYIPPSVPSTTSSPSLHPFSLPPLGVVRHDDPDGKGRVASPTSATYAEMYAQFYDHVNTNGATTESSVRNSTDVSPFPSDALPTSTAPAAASYFPKSNSAYASGFTNPRASLQLQASDVHVGRPASATPSPQPWTRPASATSQPPSPSISKRSSSIVNARSLQVSTTDGHGLGVAPAPQLVKSEATSPASSMRSTGSAVPVPRWNAAREEHVVAAGRRTKEMVWSHEFQRFIAAEVAKSGGGGGERPS